MASILSKIKELESEDDDDDDENEEDNTVPDLLRIYVLGVDESGRDLYDDLMDNVGYGLLTMKNDPNSITDAHDTVIYLNGVFGDYLELDHLTNIYIKYNNIGYKILVDYDENESTNTTTDVVKVYEPSGEEGEIVQYKANTSDANATDWLVLYDNGNTVDITPVDIDDDWTYKLGYEDPAAADALPSEGNLERAIWSYNHAVDTLNEYCETIVTNPTAQAVRSVGTGFGQSDTSIMYSSTFLANNPAGQAGDYNEVGKVGDMNAEQDVVRMSFFYPGSSYDECGYANTGKMYWLTSRSVRPEELNFGVHYVSNDRICERRCPFVGCQHK